MRLIGCVCKHGDVFSLAVLIGRGLDLFEFQSELFSLKHFIFSVFPLHFPSSHSSFVQFLGCDFICTEEDLLFEQVFYFYIV